MSRAARTIIAELTRRYARAGALNGGPSGPGELGGAGGTGGTVADVDLRALVALHPDPDDDLLAEVIEADARCRLTAGRPVTLERYLEAVPDLPVREVALDAAIEYVLQARSGNGQAAKSREETVEAMVREHPELEAAIREAMMLSEALEEPAGSAATVVEEEAVPELPRGFGPALPTGRPRYLLREKLGSGSHGTVFLAVDRQLSEQGRPALVAIKVMSGTTDAAARRRLIEEATKARRIEHPNVVRILDRGRSAASPRDEEYVIFEYVPGGSLDDRLRNRAEPMEPREAARLMARVARGVQAAHSAGLVHCDLKPANIMVTAEGQPKVADFGVAVRHDEVGGGGDTPSKRIGNLAFISPEQYRLEPGSLAPPTDIYALGGILYYLLTNRLPNGSTPDQVAAAHAAIGGRQEAPSPRAVRSGIDRDLDAICRRALAVRPQDRYGSAESMASDLEAWLEHRPIPWNRPGVWRAARMLARRQPAVVIAATLIAVAALVVGGIVGYQLGARGAARAATPAQGAGVVPARSGS